MEVKVGDKVLMISGGSTLSIERVEGETTYQCQTRCVDAGWMADDNIYREYMEKLPPTRMHKERLAWFTTPARISISGHGEHVVVGVYWRA